MVRIAQRPMKRLACALVLLAMQAVDVRARQNSGVGFDVASIKRNVSGETRVRFEMPPGRLNAINVPLRFAIRQAYRVPESRILGGPAWLDTDRFDIVATAPGPAASDARGMLQTLLQSRFGLVMHQETRDMPVYLLRVARPDGTVGSNLRRSSTDCAGRSSAIAGGRVECGILVSQGPGSGSLRGGAATLENFARLLGDFLERPLIDDTGLDGPFDFELQFSATLSASPGGPAPGGLAAAAGPDDVPTVFTALREQLGLKLDAERGQARVWVIDGASLPAVD
jgi:uncharacterized protein (TIGR03435 family)